MSETNGKHARREWVAVAVITAGALVLRFAGIGWGLPNTQHYFSYHPDEIFVLLPAFRFAQGNWNPGFFNYGPLYPYLVGLPAVALGLVPSAQFPQGLAPLYLTGRVVTALLGTATVPLLYLALRRENKSLAWGSAFVLTICPLHVINSHYATVDVPATFFLVLAFMFALRGADHPTWKTAVFTGLAVGFAAAAKYNAGLFLVPAILAPVLVRRSATGLSWWFGVPAGAAIGFLVCNPWVGSPEFRQGFLFEWRHAQAGGTLAFVGMGSGWSYHLLHGLPVALGYGLLAAVLIGFVFAFGSRSPAVRISLLWCVFYFVIIGFSKERFIRYLVPMTPFACVLAVWGVIALIRAAKRPVTENLAVGLGTAILVVTALYSLTQLVPLVLPGSREFAWIDTQSDVLAAKPQAKIGLVGAPWYYLPPVSPYNAGAFSKTMFDAWNAAHGERVVVTGWDEQKLRSARPDAFILSDLESADPLRLRDPSAVGFAMALNEVYAERQAFAEASHSFSWLAPPRSWAPPDWLYPTPRITVYYQPRT